MTLREVVSGGCIGAVLRVHEMISTVSGPSPRVAFGIGDGIAASLPAGHVLKIALVTMEPQLL